MASVQPFGGIMHEHHDASELSEAVESLASAERKAAHALEKAGVTAAEIIAAARAKSQKILEEHAANASVEKARILKEAEEDAHEECSKITDAAKKESAALAKSGSLRAKEVAKELFPIIFKVS